ncbi:hypothetical protein WA158_008422 [Blastocystis sp. Blastoise]
MDITDNGFWSVSTCKQDCGIRNLFDDDDETFWQSSGDENHFIRCQFYNRVCISEIQLLINITNDESYTPSKVSIYLGDVLDTIKEYEEYVIDSFDGWVSLPLIHDNKYPKAFYLEIHIIERFENGTDCRIRQIKVKSPKNEEESTATLLTNQYANNIELASLHI